MTTNNINLQSTMLQMAIAFFLMCIAVAADDLVEIVDGAEESRRKAEEIATKSAATVLVAKRKAAGKHQDQLIKSALL